MSRSACKKVPGHSEDCRLKLYSLVAAAAGVSVLALVHPAEGEIVITKKTIELSNGTAFVDLNKDGVNDFEFSITSFVTNSGRRHEKLAAKGLTGGKIVGRKLSPSSAPYGAPYASVLIRGAKIGQSAHFSSAKGQITIERQVHADSAGTYYGNWYQVGNNRFLGVKFQIKGKTHYGWIHLTVTTGALGGTITEYAYETVANKKITAGQTAESADATRASWESLGPSLGMLAVGADAISLWRKHESANEFPATKSAF